MNRVILVLIVFLLFFSFACAEEFDPSSVRELDVKAVMEGKGSFSGEVRKGDEIEVKVLTFKETENQELIELKEELFIGGDVFNATHEEINGNTYAVFTIRDLLNYAKSPSFTYRISARIKTNAGIGVERDYSLGEGINEFSEFIEESRFIESEDSELKEFGGDNFSSDSFLVTVREVVEWIHSSIEYDYEYYDVILPATEVFSLRKGVCDEFANLSAAFFRIKGIPTRYVVGVSFDGRKWGNHGEELQ
ncbi:MAG: transglutaminase-like domain-containing protein, partial [archaeon]